MERYDASLLAPVAALSLLAVPVLGAVTPAAHERLVKAARSTTTVTNTVNQVRSAKPRK